MNCQAPCQFTSFPDSDFPESAPAPHSMTPKQGNGRVSDDMGGVVFSVRRVSDYLSSHIDLNDYARKDIGCTQRDDGPKEVRNHHAPLTPRSTQSTGLFKRAVYSKVLQTLRGTFYKTQGI